jgi:RNA polymerase sigma factor (sigma-70 family)
MVDGSRRPELADSIVQEKILLQRFNSGDRQALRRIYDLYKVDLMTLAAALLFDRSRAEDAVHEVFARLLQGRPSIRITTSLRGYLLRAVANTARNANRQPRGGAFADTQVETADTPESPSPEGAVVRAEQCEKLTVALRRLPYEQREVVLLRHYGDLPFKAIAKCQGVSISTVQGRYRYGLDKLRSSLADHL